MNKYEKVLKKMIEYDLCVDFYCGVITTPETSEYYFNTTSFEDLIDSLQIVIDDLERENV